MSFKQVHDQHVQHWHNDAADPDREEIHEHWFRRDTADAWRHLRMYEPVQCFDHRKDLSFLTIGDGRFGLDSIRIKHFGFTDVVPTDIGDALLKKSKARGLIDDYRIENAEELTLGDDSVDVVFCKESYHHMPRAPLALYEMMRVCRFATVLIEPRDPSMGAMGVPLRALLRQLVFKLAYRYGFKKAIKPTLAELYGDGPKAAYETSGNYVYSISPRELEKVALGSNWPYVAFKGISDHYVQGGELEDQNSDAFTEIKTNIENIEHAFNVGERPTPLLIAVLFKVVPDDKTISRLEAAGFYVKKLDQNPYI